MAIHCSFSFEGRIGFLSEGRVVRTLVHVPNLKNDREVKEPGFVVIIRLHVAWSI